MKFPAETYEAFFKMACPQCADGDVPVLRGATGEYMHQSKTKLENGGIVLATGFCFSSNLRRAQNAQGDL